MLERRRLVGVRQQPVTLHSSIFTDQVGASMGWWPNANNLQEFLFNDLKIKLSDGQELESCGKESCVIHLGRRRNINHQFYFQWKDKLGPQR